MKKYMTLDQKIKCHAIIHAASVATGAVGFGVAKIPGAHHLTITPIQAGMVVALGCVFNQKITNAMAVSAITEKLVEPVGIAAAGTLWKYLPGVGNALNAGTAGAITEGLGWMMANEFARNAA